MNLTHPAVVGTVLCAGAFAVGTQIHGPDDQLAKAATPTQEQVCMTDLETFHYRAGDLCDTLPPNSHVTLQQWSSYNLANGWKLVWFNDTDGCWNTASTTDRAYRLCWDGHLSLVH